MSQSLVVVPTSETIARLRSIMLSAPFQLDWDRMVVEICQVDGSAAPWLGQEEPQRVYTDVKVLHVTPKQSYLPHEDTGVPARILVAACQSPSLARRYLEMSGAGDEPDSHFDWVLTTRLQESRSQRSFLASFTSTLVLHEGAFSFTGECTINH